MFRALICPSSGVCDYVVEIPHWLYFSWIAGSPVTTTIEEKYSQCGISTT